MKKTPVIAVVGPTASGKTALAVDIAKALNCEIISFDSMQVYKEISVSTAKPDLEEMQGITHHLIDCISICERFSVAEFCELAKEKVREIKEKGKIPLFVGGTGLYIDSFVKNIDFSVNPDDINTREKVECLYKDLGADGLYELLKKVDLKATETIHKNNIKRVKRALEIYYSGGFNKTEQDKKALENESPYDCLFIGLNYKNRENLYNRINQRVDKMAESGLIDEAKVFFEKEASNTSVQAIGIKELKPFLDGDKPLDECIEKIKQETRRYAKRQITWFKRNKEIKWFYPDEKDYSDIINESLNYIREFLKGGE